MKCIKSSIKRFWISIITAALAVSLCGCSGWIIPDYSADPVSTATPEPDTEKDDMLRLAVPGEFTSFDPLFAGSSQMASALSLIFEPLIRCGNRSAPTACLARTWEKDTSSGSVKWTVHLRSGVKWHDGSDFTADDVIYTLERIRNGVIGTAEDTQRSIYHEYIRDVQSWRKTDDYTVEFSVAAPYEGFIEKLGFPIVKNGSYDAADSGEKPPVGTGPYKANRASQSDGLELLVFSDWWKEAPRIKDIYVKTAAGRRGMTELYENGGIDVLATDDITASSLRRGSASLVEYVTEEYIFIAPNWENKLLSDKRIRQALARGMDRREIITRVYMNHAVSVDTPVSKNSHVFSEDVITIDHNVDEARALIEQAGWDLRDGNGVYYYIDDNNRKVELSFTLLINTDNADTTRKETARMLKEQWSALGMNIEIKSLPWDDYIKAIENGEYDLALCSYRFMQTPDLSYVFRNGSEGNINHVDIPALEDAIDDTLYAEGVDEYLSAWKDLQSVMVDELPYISLFYRTNSMICSGSLVVEGIPKYLDVYDMIEKWYFVEKAD